MNKITIGRDCSCNIIIDDPEGRVSRKHATLHVVGGKMILEDHSKNGTLINGKCTNSDSVEIKSGDEILLGTTVRLEWNEIIASIAAKSGNNIAKNGIMGGLMLNGMFNFFDGI